MSFLIVFLLYACYQPLRFSIEDPERQARYAAVFSIVAGAFVPLNFMAVRMAQSLVHPRVLGDHRRRDARLDAAHVPRLADRHGAAVRDAVEVRARVQARDVPAAGAEAPARRRRGAGPPTRAAPRRRSSDARAPARRGGQVRRRGVPGLPRAGPDLRGDHGRAAGAHRAGPGRGDRRCWSGASPRRRTSGSRSRGERALRRSGASHKTAPLAVRERLALLDGQVEAFLHELVAHPGSPRPSRSRPATAPSSTSSASSRSRRVAAMLARARAAARRRRSTSSATATPRGTCTGSSAGWTR